MEKFLASGKNSRKSHLNLGSEEVRIKAEGFLARVLLAENRPL